MFVTVFYVVVFISGLLGNLSVIVLVVRSKDLHSAMNYYLISLAIADILIIILGELYQVLALYIFTTFRYYNGRHDTTIHNANALISCVGTIMFCLLYSYGNLKLHKINHFTFCIA